MWGVSSAPPKIRQVERGRGLRGIDESGKKFKESHSTSESPALPSSVAKPAPASELAKPASGKFRPRRSRKAQNGRAVTSVDTERLLSTSEFTPLVL